mgnify:CR=1 FL=1
MNDLEGKRISKVGLKFHKRLLKMNGGYLPKELGWCYEEPKKIVVFMPKNDQISVPNSFMGYQVFAFPIDSFLNDVINGVLKNEG